jgi:hypothetical protein
MKRLILISVLSSFVSCVVAAEPVVGARVVKSGLIATQAAFIVEAGLTNTSSDTFSCAIMSCSWWTSWRVEPHSVFEVSPRFCVGNFPMELNLVPSESTTFKFQVVCRGTNVPPDVKRMKVGFVVYPWKGKGDLFQYAPGIEASGNVIWSTEFDLPPVGTQSIEDWNKRK